MSNKDNKCRSLGISDLASNIGTSPRQGYSQSSNQVPSKKKIFELLHLLNWPSFPFPWSSKDPGETWVWGDFFLTFQKEPEIVATFLTKINGDKPKPQALKYHYAMIVFYRLDRNPHEPLHQPIMAIGLEQIDMSMVGTIFGKDMLARLQIEDSKGMGALMLGLFTAESHANLGHYVGDTHPQAVKKRFFEVLASCLPVSGQPKMIGSLADAHGHPETGLPAKNNPKEKSRYAPVILLFIGICGLVTCALLLV